MQSFYLNATTRRLTLLCLLAATFFSTLSAQDTTTLRMHEVGLQISNFNLENFGLVYKIQRPGKENRYIRYRFVFTNLSFSKSDNIDERSFNASLGGSVGIEQRTNISDRIQFLYGPELRTSFRHTNSNFDDSQNTNKRNETNVSLGLGYILGLQYNFDSRFYINLEISPNISVDYTASTVNINNMENKNTRWGTSANVNSDGVILTFAYRFGVARK